MLRSAAEALKSSPLIRRFTPDRLKKLFRNGPRVEITPLDEAFPAHERRPALPPETVSTPEAPEMHPWQPAADLLAQDTFTTPEAFTTVLRDALYDPTNSALLTPSRAVVAESLGVPRVDYPFEGEALHVDRVQRLSGYGTPLRYFRTNHYHTLVDALPRLHLLREAPYAQLDEIKLLHTGTLSPVEALFIENMCPNNARPVKLEEGCLYEVENYILASFLSRQFSGCLPATYLKRFRRKMLPIRSPRSDRRIFISRQHTAKRSIENYEEVQACIRRFGLQEYVLEDLPVREQIELFYDAEMVVAAHGAGLTNLLFAGSQTRVVEIFSTPYVLPHYYYLCKSLGHPYTYTSGEEMDRRVDFSVDVTQLAAAIEAAERQLENHAPERIDR